MKKNIIILIVIALTLLACNENSSNLLQQEDNVAIPNAKASKEYTIVLSCGHKSSDCNNSCTSVGGSSFHVDCTGGGTACTKTIGISLSLAGKDLYNGRTIYKYELTDADFFLMPDRSLAIEEGRWLNIPEQLVYRDSRTGVFTFTGLFFTKAQHYKNE